MSLLVVLVIVALNVVAWFCLAYQWGESNGWTRP